MEPNGATSNDFGASGDFGTSGLNGSNIPTASGGWKPARQAISNFTSQRSGFQAEKSSAGMYTGQWSNSGSNPNGTNNMSVSSGTLGSVPATNSSIRSGVFDAHDSHSSTNHNTMQNGMGSNGLGSNGLGLNGLGSNGPTLMAPSFATSSNSSLLNLEMRLTREMIKPPSEWDLVTLTTEVQQAGRWQPANKTLSLSIACWKRFRIVARSRLATEPPVVTLAQAICKLGGTHQINRMLTAKVATDLEEMVPSTR